MSGGGNPIGGSALTLYAIGSSGYGGGNDALATAISSNTGAFTFSFTCPSGNPQTYVVAIGGDAGGGSNSAIGLVALSGPCDSLSSAGFVTVNELTTVAAEYALAQFSDSSGQNLGTSATNATGLNNAVGAAQSNLVVSYLANGDAANTGIPASFLPTPAQCAAGSPPYNCDALERLNTLANILAACVAGGSGSSQCATLMSSTGSGTTTAAAVHFMATNPTTNVGGLFALQGGGAPYQPALSVVPGDLAMGLNFALGVQSPQSLAIDRSGNVWVSFPGNQLQPEAAVAKLSPAGALLATLDNSSLTGANFSQPYDLAIDALGNVWVTNHGASSMTAITSSGGLFGTFTNVNTQDPSAFFGPQAVAIDSQGNVWVANVNSNSVTELPAGCSPTGCAAKTFNPSAANFNDPSAVAIDAGGHVWVTNQAISISGFPSVTELDSAGNLVGNYAPSGANFNDPTALAVDANGNVWVANALGDSVTELSASGALLGNFSSAGGTNFSTPSAVEVDGANNIWLTNGNGDSVTEILTPCAGAGCSGRTLHVAGPTVNNHPLGAGIDASGDLWTVNILSGSASELIGVAAPVKTPLSACLSQTPATAVCKP